jgi:hypothetical protein
MILTKRSGIGVSGSYKDFLLIDFTDTVLIGQYNAWCLRNGDHYTEKRGAVNWNSELIWKMRMELEFQWGLLEDEIPVVLDGLLESIKACLLELTTHLQGKTPLSYGEFILV